MLKKTRVVEVATNSELMDFVYRYRLKLAVNNTEIGQRYWPTCIQDMLLYAYMTGIDIRDPSGGSFEIPLVDDVWNGNERYIREFLMSTECIHPEKDRLIDLYFRVMMPNIARHFGR